MKIVSGSSCFIIILTTILYCNGEDDKVFTMIFGTKNGSIIATKSDQPQDTTQIGRFANEISGLAVYDGYLYISIKVHTFINRDSSIWRCKITNSTNFTVERSTCQDFDDLRLLSESILSMVIAEDHIYAGRTDNVMWRCSAKNKKSCEIFDQSGSEITGIDYNYFDDGKIYASLASGTLWRCSKIFANVCNDIYKSNHGLTTVKIAYGAIWVGTQKGELLKCTYTESEGGKCDVFAESSDLVVVSIAAANGRLFVGLKNKYLLANLFSHGSKMWRCDPNLASSCNSTFAIPSGTRSFIIV